MAWTDEREEELKKLHERGLSRTEIADLLGGTTASAVTGKLDRLGLLPNKGDKKILSKRRSEGGSKGANKFNGRSKFKSDDPKPPPKPFVDPVDNSKDNKNKTLAKLLDNECRWPTKRVDGVQLFCGRKSRYNKSYCDFHHNKSLKNSK
jgi:hypothetical protein